MIRTPARELIVSELVSHLGSCYQGVMFRLSGAGCINETYEVYGSGVDSVFLKLGAASQIDMYEKEVLGLGLLAQCKAVRVPNTYFRTTLAEYAVLAMEFISLKPVSAQSQCGFGLALAQLHSVEGNGFGLDHNNYIGRTHQINQWCKDWWEFYALHRLLPQRKLAQLKGMRNAVLQDLDRLIDRLPQAMKGYAPKPSLLHGDLWSGNIAVDDSGQPTLFDPAVYYGDAETDLAMSRMFGSMAPEVYRAYHELLPQQPGHELRRNLYDLYHWLNHFNLFGVGYLGQVEITLADVLQKLD
jgi:protein-ribulosamine 3-kinase